LSIAHRICCKTGFHVQVRYLPPASLKFYTKEKTVSYRFQPSRMYQTGTYCGSLSGPWLVPDGRGFECKDTDSCAFLSGRGQR